MIDFTNLPKKRRYLEPTQKMEKKRFWDMFIVDALIGNWDRHNGNWGFLFKTSKKVVTRK